MQLFVPITIFDTDQNDLLKTIFINTNLIQSIHQLESDVIITMTNYETYTIPDVNLQVFMDRFKR
jgi:hypothetical protein